MPSNLGENHHLRICVLGPMASPDCRTIKQAVESLLAEPELTAVLQRNGVTVTTVDIPENPNGCSIQGQIRWHESAALGTSLRFSRDAAGERMNLAGESTP